MNIYKKYLLSREKKIGVWGTGYIGLSTMAYFAREKIESIGPKMGNELRINARNAIIAALFLIGLYITIRFNSFYAIGSLVALLHDIFIIISIFSLFNFEISIVIIAAFLTIVGYSLNDTIVIYDRIRENLKIYPDGEKSNIINKSLNINIIAWFYIHKII